MTKRLLIIFLLILTRQHLIAGGDSTWTLHAGLLYCNISSDDSKVFAGLDMKAGYTFHRNWQSGLNVHLLLLDDNTVSPYTLAGGGPYLRWMPGRLFLDLSGTIVSGVKKKETITMLTGRFSIGAQNKISDHLDLTPQVFIQFENVQGTNSTAIWRPGIILSVVYHL